MNIARNIIAQTFFKILRCLTTTTGTHFPHK